MQKQSFSLSFEMPRVTTSESDSLRQRSFSGDSHMNCRSARSDPPNSFKSSTVISCSSSSSSSNGLNASRYKTELCRPYQEYGYCKYGEKCQFAHGVHDLRSLPRHPKYKTELCRTFYSTGYCPYGSRCHFIHSKNESQQQTRSFPRPIVQAPPTSPSQDSGISSPDENKLFFVNGSGGGKVFDFPLSDSSPSDGFEEEYSNQRYSDWSNGYSSPVDPVLSDLDSYSSCSLSPAKPFVPPAQAFNELDLTEKLSSVSLDDEIFTTSSHSRLPVFDMLNSRSATLLDIGGSGGWQ